jgi:hypothetical protein
MFPLIRSSDNPLTLDEIKDALNNLNERLSAVEMLSAPNATPSSGEVFTAGDRAVLTEIGQFLGVHAVVANTVASRDAGVADIDPGTGLSRVVPDRPAVDVRSQPGGFSSSPVQMPGA